MHMLTLKLSKCNLVRPLQLEGNFALSDQGTRITMEGWGGGRVGPTEGLTGPIPMIYYSSTIFGGSQTP